jgi:hypothetical protein
LKKITIISFLVLVFLSQAGYYFIYSIQQYYIREEVKEQILAGLPEHYLQAIEQTAGIHWEEEGKELYFNGDLYDVVKTKKENGKTILYCFNDKKEGQLLKEIEQQFKEGSASGKPGKRVVRFELHDYTLHQLPEMKLPCYSIEQKYFILSSSMVTAFQRINVPPPRL